MTSIFSRAIDSIRGVTRCVPNDQALRATIDRIVADETGTPPGTYTCRTLEGGIMDPARSGDTGVHTDESEIFIPRYWPIGTEARLELAIRTAADELRRIRDEFGAYAAPGSRLRYEAFERDAEEIFDAFKQRTGGKMHYANPYAAYDLYLLVDSHASRQRILSTRPHLRAAGEEEAALARMKTHSWSWKPVTDTYSLTQFREALGCALMAGESAITSKNYAPLLKKAIELSRHPHLPKAKLAKEALAIYDEAAQGCLPSYAPRLDEDRCGTQGPYREIHAQAFSKKAHPQMLMPIKYGADAHHLQYIAETHAEREDLARLLRRLTPRSRGPVRAYQGDMLDPGEHALATMQRAAKGYASPRKMFFDDTLNSRTLVRVAVVLDESYAMRIAGNYGQAQETAAVLFGAWGDPQVRTGKVKIKAGLYAGGDALRPLVKIGDTPREPVEKMLSRVAPRTNSDICAVLDGLRHDLSGHARGTNIAAIISHGDPYRREDELQRLLGLLRATNTVPLLITHKTTRYAAIDAGWPHVIRMRSNGEIAQRIEAVLLESGAIAH